MAEPMYCYRHPKRETRVSCATCGRPICTECMVATDVGIKCPDDARLPRGARAGVMKSDQVLRSILPPPIHLVDLGRGRLRGRCSDQPRRGP
jgi:hypothetical protein